MFHQLEKQLEEIKLHISQQTVAQKEIFTLSEAAAYAGVSKSFFYKLTASRKITFYRPATKLIFFKRTEIDAWLLKNMLPTTTELAQI